MTTGQNLQQNILDATVLSYYINLGTLFDIYCLFVNKYMDSFSDINFYGYWQYC